MPRPPRIQVPGGLYHLTSRGVRRERIFHDAFDWASMLELLADVVERFGWRCHTYCLMSNHYHLVIETPEPNLSRGMQRLNCIYAKRFNARYGFSGHAFEARFHSDAVESDAHLLGTLRYVVLNPVRAGIVGHPADWPWSSYRCFAGLAPRPSFLVTDHLAYFGRVPETACRGFRAFVAEELERQAA
jgi:putative transposase